MFLKKHGKRLAALGFTISVLSLCACGEPAVPENPQEGFLAIDKEGTVKECLVENFDKDYYDVKELESFIKDEAASYNAKHSEAIQNPVMVDETGFLTTEAGVDSTRVRSLISYASCTTYADYNEAVLYYGSAAEGEYLVGDKVIPAEYKEKKVIITNCTTKVYAPYKVKWVSGNYPVEKDGSVNLTQAAENEKVAIVLAE